MQLKLGVKLTEIIPALKYVQADKLIILYKTFQVVKYKGYYWLVLY